MHIRRSVAAVVAASALGLTGCGLGGGGGEQTTPEATGAPEGEITGEITFSTLQLKPTFTEYIEGVIADFEAEYPGTTVNWIDVPFQGAQEKIIADAQAGTLPDVINLNPNFAQPLAVEGIFANLDEVAPGVGEQYVPGAYEAFTVPGQEGHFGFPWYLTSEVTMVNSDLMEQSGLDPEQPPATFDELTAAARTVAQAGDGKFYGMHPALENKVATDLVKLGVPLLNEEQTEWVFNTPEAVAYVQELVDLYDEGVFPPDSLTEDHSKEIEAYQAGRIALFPSGPNFLTIVRENAPQVADATVVAPQIAGEDGAANMAVMGLLVPQSSPNLPTALAFAEFMTNAENQLEFAKIVTILPSVTEALEDPYFTDTSDGTVDSLARKISAEQIATAKNMVPVQFDDRVKSAVIGQIQRAMNGQQSAEEAVQKAVDEANAISFR
jgi:ABC-type glycerol-3-phosphate transport system substrate-binding protein